ncbi:MAG: XRE family transcriptional regulator [Clostridia bacterium]
MIYSNSNDNSIYKILRKTKNKSQLEVSKDLSVDASTISKWERGISIPDQTMLITLANYYNTSVDVLLGRPINENQIDIFQYENIAPICKRRIPMIGTIACGVPKYADEDKESYVECGTNIQADFCLKALGDSMTGARINSGDIVFCRKQDAVNNGEIAAIIIGDEATLKRVYFYPKTAKLVLQAENPAFEPFVYVGEELNEIHIIGKAVAFQSDVK